MSKTHDTSKLRIEDVEALDLGGATFTARELRDDELENVSGGKVNLQDMHVTYKISDGTSNTLLIGE
jgi:hypothetical protein